MPHPKNRLKMSGDTHLPDLDYGPGADDEALAMQVDLPNEVEPVIYADGYVPSSLDSQPAQQPQAEDTSLKEVAVEKLGQQTARSPWLAIGAALALGYLLTKKLRRR